MTLATPTPVVAIFRIMLRRNDPFVASAVNAAQIFVSSVPAPSNGVAADAAADKDVRNVSDVLPLPQRPVLE
jgi:hypothetical protein